MAYRINHLFNKYKSMKKTTGYVTSIPDARDVFTSEITLGSTDKNKTRWGADKNEIKRLQVEDQGSHPTCMGQTLSKLLETYNTNKYSARYLYVMTDTIFYKRRNQGQSYNKALSVLKALGGVTDDVYPDNNKSTPSEYYKGVVYQTEADKVHSYARVPIQIDEIKKAFDTFKFLPISFRYYKTKRRSTGEIVYDDREGGHAVLATHLELKQGKLYLHFINSWGERWGDDGHGFVELEKALEDGMKFEFLAVTKDPVITKKIVKVVEEKKELVKQYKYFSATEVAGLPHEFVLKLDKARGYAGIPFAFNSTVRTVAQNKAVGGVANSSHIAGLAVDIRCRNSSERKKIMDALNKAGIGSRIGIGNSFVHVDVDLTKTQEVYWLYN